MNRKRPWNSSQISSKIDITQMALKLSSTKPAKNRKMVTYIPNTKEINKQKQKKIVFIFLSCHHNVSQAPYLKHRKLRSHGSRSQKSKIKSTRKFSFWWDMVADSPVLAVSSPGFFSTTHTDIDGEGSGVSPSSHKDISPITLGHPDLNRPLTSHYLLKGNLSR